jgi:polyhydroxybutyrate depolymerase
MLAFHGAGGNGPATESSTGLTQAADSAGFFTVYPNADGTFWRYLPGDPRGTRDVTFVRLLLDQLDAVLCVADNRVYATGGSNGAGFVSVLGCRLNDRLTAIAPVAGIYRPQPGCPPRRPLSVLEIHGTNDGTAPYDGSMTAGTFGVTSFLDEWFQWDSCASGPPVYRRLGRWALWLAKSGCADGTTVAHIKLIGEPHAWPLASRAAHAAPSRAAHAARTVAFDASRAIVHFFQTETVATVAPRYRRRHGARARQPRRPSSTGGAVSG